MSQTRDRPAWPEPRIEAEPLAAPRLEAALVSLPPEPPVPRSSLSLALTGVGILGLGLSGLWCAGFVIDQFARGAVSGWLTLGVTLAGFALLGTALWRELRGLFALESVDRLRGDFASGEPRRVRAAARRWLTRIGADPALLPALAAAEQPDAVLALLRAGPAAALRDRTDALARLAAVQVGAIIAATPSPALDALTVGWRGVRLVRQVAALYGQRPGLLGTLALLRRTALSAAGVAATELAVNAATHALLSNPLLERVLGDMAGAGVAARRMVVLARAAALACSPLPPR